MKNNARLKWVDAGYELFAKEGPEGIQVERLARILKTNKSGFYHYFKSQENFRQELFCHHKEHARQMGMEIQQCLTLDPDYFNILVKHKRCIMMQIQLDRNSNHTAFRKVIKEVRELTDQPLIPLWRKSFRLPNNEALVLRHFNLFKSAFYAQVNSENLTYEFLHTMKSETSKMMSEVFRNSRWYEIRLRTFHRKIYPAADTSTINRPFSLIDDKRILIK